MRGVCFRGPALAAAILTFLVLASVGCRPERAVTQLKITVSKAPATRLQFSVTCTPPGGSVPDATRLCRTLRAHPSMLFPPPVTATCAGSYGVPPDVEVSGRFEGRRIDISIRSCEAPAARGQAATLWLQALGQ